MPMLAKKSVRRKRKLPRHTRKRYAEFPYRVSWWRERVWDHECTHAKAVRFRSLFLAVQHVRRLEAWRESRGGLCVYIERWDGREHHEIPIPTDPLAPETATAEIGGDHGAR